jgi:hypothetical protein
MPNQIKFVTQLVILTLLLDSVHAIAAKPGESIVLDPNTGDYTITYWGSDKTNAQLSKVIFVPATKIEPTVQSVFKLRGASEVFYSYRVSNGKKSRQSLVSIRLDPASSIILPLPSSNNNIAEQLLGAEYSAITKPENWTGISTSSRAGGVRISWSPTSDEGLPPGKTQAGFGFSSRDIPGIGMAQMQGDTPVQMYPDEGPVSDLANELERMEQHDFVTRPAAIPAITVPNPFNAAILLERIQTQTHTWIAMQLLDATFSSQLDRSLTAAANAYRLNQPKAGKEHIQTLRKMLKKEHDDADKDDDKEDSKHDGKHDDKVKRVQIDRLAARVLDFDLKYVLKRMGGEKDD